MARGISRKSCKWGIRLGVYTTGQALRGAQGDLGLVTQVYQKPVADPYGCCLINSGPWRARQTRRAGTRKMPVGTITSNCRVVLVDFKILK